MLLLSRARSRLNKRARRHHHHHRHHDNMKVRVRLQLVPKQCNRHRLLHQAHKIHHPTQHVSSSSSSSSPLAQERHHMNKFQYQIMSMMITEAIHMKQDKVYVFTKGMVDNDMLTYNLCRHWMNKCWIFESKALMQTTTQQTWGKRWVLFNSIPLSVDQCLSF